MNHLIPRLSHFYPLLKKRGYVFFLKGRWRSDSPWLPRQFGPFQLWVVWEFVWFQICNLAVFFPDIKSENFCMKALDFESVAKICQNHTNLRFFRTKRSNFVPDSERERLVVSGQLWWVVAPVPALRSSDFFLVTKNLLVFWHQTRFESFLSTFEYMVK